MSLEHKIKTSFIRKAASFFKRHLGIAALSIGIGLFSYGCIDEGCRYDSQCSHNRICAGGECIQDPNYNPNNNNTPYDSNDQDTVEPDTIENNGCPDPTSIYYMDADGDGFGNESTWICEDAPGFVKNKDDCDDTNALMGKSITCNYDGKKCGTAPVCAAECPVPPLEDQCDDEDNNCNGQIDEGKIIEYQQTCSNDKLHWQDECGNIGAVIETCINNTDCDTTCVGNKVHYKNECGGIEALVETCTAKEKCIEGIYECVPYCINQECGDDGYGGSCGNCEDCLYIPYGYEQAVCEEYGLACKDGKCVVDFTKFDNLCNQFGGWVDIKEATESCNPWEICVPWCNYKITNDHNEYVCCPKDKPMKVVANPEELGISTPPTYVVLCCGTCYADYSLTEMPSDCVLGKTLEGH